MKSKQLKALMMAGIMGFAIVGFTGKSLAHGGEDETLEEPAESTPVNSPSSDDSSSSNTAQAAKVTVTNSLKQVEAVETENDDQKPGQSGRMLADDSDQKSVVLRVKNGQAFQVIKTKDATGKETETEVELATGDALTVSGHDSSGKDSQIKIKFKNGRFELSQNNLSVISNFPVSIDPSNNTISVVTPAGLVALHGLPSAAIAQLEQKRLFDDLDQAEIEDENESQNVSAPNKVDATAESKTAPISEKLIIKISAHKTVKLLGLLPVQAPITAKLAPDTGTAAVTSQPWFLNLLGFLFSR